MAARLGSGLRQNTIVGWANSVLPTRNARVCNKLHTLLSGKWFKAEARIQDTQYSTKNTEFCHRAASIRLNFGSVQGEESALVHS